MKTFVAPETGVYVFRYIENNRGIAHLDKDQVKELDHELIMPPSLLRAMTYEDFIKHNETVFDLILNYYSFL